MSSVAAIIPDDPQAPGDRGEQEPLLGRPGDAAQPKGMGIQYNFILGTAILAQIGIWILAAIIWASVFSHKLIFFSAHPLLNSAGLLLVTQGILVLQPTHTPSQKYIGTHIHSILNNVGVLALIGGLVVIEYNKISHNGEHFRNTHAILGLATASLMVVQSVVGGTQYFLPQLYGGEANAKKIYKYHRLSGYAVLILAFATVAAATTTDYNRDVLHIQLWAVVLASIVTLLGVLPRIKKQKIGL
ncbi:MAG: hypothetical protein M1826_003330 [Phylliscum demangeonii]|nr:MAG: hypothetical protein M1826_003330 [Phylliscum demangeonii]